MRSFSLEKASKFQSCRRRCHSALHLSETSLHSHCAAAHRNNSGARRSIFSRFEPYSGYLIPFTVISYLKLSAPKQVGLAIRLAVAPGVETRGVACSGLSPEIHIRYSLVSSLSILFLFSI